jgi:hypothetical protein
MPARFCPSCGAELSAQARFCHRCGAPAGAASGAIRTSNPERTAWLVASVVALALLGVIGWRMIKGTSTAPPPSMANAGNVVPPSGANPDPGGNLPTGQAPDISQLSPEERFLRLDYRVMTAAAQRDSATVVNFTPMALGAYAQLPAPTLDDRYHAAVLNAQVGRFDEALALADTMLGEVPNHLLARVVQGDVAELTGSSAALASARTAFLEAWDSEITRRREEYADHRDVLDDFRQRAGAP